MNHRIYDKWDSEKREAYTVCACAWESRIDARFGNPTTEGNRHMEAVRKAVCGVITVKFGRKHYTATCSAHGLLYVGTCEQIVAYVYEHHLPGHPSCTFEEGGATQNALAPFILAYLTEKNGVAV